MENVKKETPLILPTGMEYLANVDIDIDSLEINDHTEIEENFGKWKVSKNGRMDYDNGRYIIEPTTLDESDTISQMMGKAWVDLNYFMPAYFKAISNIGKSSLEIIVNEDGYKKPITTEELEARLKDLTKIGISYGELSEIKFPKLDVSQLSVKIFCITKGGLVSSWGQKLDEPIESIVEKVKHKKGWIGGKIDDAYLNLTIDGKYIKCQIDIKKHKLNDLLK